MTAFEAFQQRFVRAADGPALVVGSKVYGTKLDRRELYADAVGVDLFEGDGVDLVHDMETPAPEGFGPFAHVDCCSVLEHVKRPWKLAETIESVLRPGGTLLVLVPFAWRVHSYPGDYWRMTPQALEVLFPRVRWKDARFLVGGALRKMAPGKRAHGLPWIARSEVAAFGVRCND